MIYRCNGILFKIIRETKDMVVVVAMSRGQGIELLDELRVPVAWFKENYKPAEKKLDKPEKT